MSLDVPVPEPPSLSSAIDADDYDDVSVQGEDYRREELQDFLESGAWETAFLDWAAETSLPAADFEIARDLDLIAEFDFFWDDFADRVGYHAPGIPEDWRERAVHPDLDSWETVSGINAGLTELGQIVCEVLAEEYIDWEADFEGPGDLPDFE
ncbi:MAG: hypothetical protein V5A43_02740 [Haloarculaceae archaeon]